MVDKFPGVTLDRNHPVLSIKDKIAPQGRAEDAAAQNANIAPIAVAGVNVPAIINANGDKIGEYNSNNDNSIISVTDIPQASAPQNLPIKIAENDDAEGNVIEEED